MTTMHPTRPTSPSAKLLAAMLVSAGLPAIASAQFVLTGSSYSQNFDSIGSGLPTNWDVRTAANATALGTAATPILTPATATDWSNTGGGFKNFASATGLASTETSLNQQAATDRALGIRQTGSIGDPGAAFNFNFNATGKTFSALSIDLEMLRVETRSTTWTLQYGLGATPSSFTTLSTFADPVVFGTTTVSFNAGALAGINNQANVWFRVVALTASTGGGSRDSFGIDNFSLTYAASGSDVSIGGGFDFTASSFGGAAFAAGDIAVFNGTAGTVNLSGAVAASGLKFVSDGYTLASPTGADTIAVAGGVEVADGSTATLSGKVTGSNALTKTGAGTLILSNADNDFVGNVSVNAGTLQIGSDAVLGGATNSINLGGGTFEATSSLALGAGRGISGSGELSVGSGNTLTVNGTVNASNVKLSGSGTVALQGASNTISALEFADANQVSGNALTTDGITSTAYTGTAVVANALNFGSSADRSLTIVGDVELAGALTQGGASRRLIKTGVGTLTLSGDQSGNLGGVRLGVQGTTPSEGGTLAVSADNALGATTFQFNSGTLTSATERSFGNALSIGGRNNGVSASTLSGAAMTFTGTGNGFFGATGTSGQLALDVNNATTVTGSWLATGGSGGVTGIDLGGTGSLTLTGDTSLVTQTWALQDSVTFLVTQSLGGGVIVNEGTTFGGGATIAGAAGLSVQSGATLQFAFDGLGVDTLGSTDFELISGGSGLIAVDFGGTALVGTYDLVTFNTLTGFTEGNVSGFEVTNLDAGFTGSLSLTANALQITVSAIPEPSAFAALAGVVALGCVASRRRRMRA